MKQSWLVLLSLISVFLIIGCTISPTGNVVKNNSNESKISLGDFDPIQEIVPIESIVPKEQIINEENYDAVVEVVEGETVDLNPEAVDPDGDRVEYTFSEPLDKVGRWRTRDGDEGLYEVKVTATDGSESTDQLVLIRVTPSNKPPTINCPELLSTKEGETITIDCEFFDKEGDRIIVTYGGYISSKSKEVGFEDAGKQVAIVTATDGNRESTFNIEIVVGNVNRAPEIEPIGEVEAIETDTIKLNPKVSDPDGDFVKLSYSGLFDEQGVWKTKDGDSGTYFVTVIASDGKTSTKENFDLIIRDINSEPILERIGNLEFVEGDLIELPVSAYDREGDEIDIVVSGWMDDLEYQTNFDDAGSYEVTVSVSDAEYTVSETFTVTVKNKNRAPVFKIPA